MSSSLSELRNFRLNKGSANTNGANPSNKLANGRKRIRAMSDSSDDEHIKKQATPQKPIENGKTSSTMPLTTKDKEERFHIFRAIVDQNVESLILQDFLVRNDWDVQKAYDALQENPKYKNSGKHSSPDLVQQSPSVSANHSNTTVNYSPTSSTANHSPSSAPTNHSLNASVEVVAEQKQKSSKSKKRRVHSSDGGGSTDDGGYGASNRVYNSEEDSDDDTSFLMTKGRKQVLEFLNTGTNSELMAVKSLSAKKIEVLLPLRPFNDWTDLRFKIDANKSLSLDMLNACQEYLNQRNNMDRIMKKCKKLVTKLENAVAKGDKVVTQPSLLNHDFKLADYQLVGLNWLAIIHSQRMNGILADEMGLGKTIQVIAFLAYLKETNQSHGTHLIVVPSSTLDNWDNELAKWCPALIVEKYYGSAAERRSLRIQWSKGGLKGVDVLLTTYHMVASSPEERKMFRVTRMHYVIFDEAHMLKNMTTQRYIQLAQINAECRLLLTGTPLQNNLLELMSLLCFVMPSMFANNTDDIKNLFQKTKQIKGEELTAFEKNQIEQAKQIMKPFVLRRLKDVVLTCLPEKKDVTIKIPLTDSQKEHYMELVELYSSDDGIVQATNEQSGISIMMDMRKLANHPLLLRYYYSDETVHEIANILSTHPNYKKNRNPQYVFEELAPLSDFQLFQTMQNYQITGFKIPDRLIVDSGKFRELDRLLPKLKAEGHRVLIFSQFTMMLDILERYLSIRDHQFLRFDGQTAVVERQAIIDEYIENEENFVFLLSTKAGGLGINLIAADTVIIHDIDFNPYNDKQAEDRCHRMGQTKPVTIYRFIAEGTIEEGMAMVAKEKLNLEREITTDEGDSENGESNEQDHKCMVRLLTMALGMKDENKAESMISPVKKMSVS